MGDNATAGMDVNPQNATEPFGQKMSFVVKLILAICRARDSPVKI